MPDIQKAWEHLQRTKTGYANLKVKPPTDKNSAWYKALVELGVIEPGTPPPPTGSLGAQLRAAFPPLTGLTLIDDAGKPPRTSGPFDTSGRKHYRNVTRTGNGPDGFKATGSGATDLVYQLCNITGLTRPDPSQPAQDHNSVNAFGLMHGARRIRILGGEAQDLGHAGHSKFDHGVYAGEASEVLIAGWLAHDIGGKVLQFYPGPTQAVVTNCTIGWVRTSPNTAVIVENADVTIYNSIIWGAVTLNSGTLRLINCCVPPQFSISGGVAQTGTIREDPGFAAGSYRPTNPKLLTGADPGWVPEHDYRGTPYTRATVGAVAA